ncbi:MAG TPA: LacI family DNA-binding transcriptional regulator [Negativicutes bacterium]
MGVNIYDIANEAGVSITTVSRVLNNKGNVNAKTRAHVQSILDKNNYTPNAMARGLVSKSMKTIGVLTIDIRTPHYAATAYAIERELYKIGYSVILCNTGGGMEENTYYIKMLTEKKVDGIILIGSVFSQKNIEKTYIPPSLPVILLNNGLELNTQNIYSVLIDEVFGSELCVKHLYEKGHTKILFVKDDDTYSASKKESGFMETMRNIKLQVDKSSIFKTQRGLEGGTAAVDDIIKSGKEFTAIMFSDDSTAVGGLKRLQQLGYNVPKDVAITGFNNSIYAEMCQPSLTSVDNKVEMMGSLTAKLLESLINGQNTTKSVSVKPDLVPREST